MGLALLAALLLSTPSVAADVGAEAGMAAGLGALSYGNTVVFGTLLMASQASPDLGKHPAPHYAPLYVPVVGPFWAAKTLDTHGGDRRLLITDGVLQTAAVGLTVLALARPSKGKNQLAMGFSPVSQLRVSGVF